MPNTRRVRFATPLRPEITGRNAVTNSPSGGPSHRAVRSGAASARFFGTISPSTMCSSVTSDSATANPTIRSTSSGTSTTACTAPSSRCATAGSPT